MDAVPHYAVRVGAMVLMSEFHPTTDELRNPLKTISSACQRLVTTQSLQNFLAFVLQLGNYINAVRCYRSVFVFVFRFDFYFLFDLTE